MMRVKPPPYEDGHTVAEPEPVALDATPEHNLASAGLTGAFRTPRIDAQTPSYALLVRAVARATDGGMHSTQFGLPAYNPIVAYEQGPAELVETYAPIAVGSCQEAAIGPTRVTYVDSQSVTRSRQESLVDTDAFSEALSRGRSVSLGESESNETSYSTKRESSKTNSQAESFEAGVKLTASVEAGFPLIGSAKVSVEGSFVYTRTSAVSHTDAEARTDSASKTLGRTSATTDTQSLTDTQATSRTHDFSNSESSTELTSSSISGEIFPGTGAVWYRQESRYVQRGVIVSYSLCGEEQVIGEVSYPDYRWAVELAAGPSCTPLPAPTDLKPAQCYLPPCESQ
ncbi:MAG: hypothetical protein QM778_28490 [Myxococcales bacterium]